MDAKWFNSLDTNSNFRSFKTPFCIASYIGEAINGCNFIHQDDAFPFIQYFIEFCSSEGSEEILSVYAKNFKKKPYWKLSDAKNRMRAYQNSLMITNFISCRKTWNKRLEYYKIFITLFLLLRVPEVPVKFKFPGLSKYQKTEREFTYYNQIS